jgi:hypothetical protein
MLRAVMVSKAWPTVCLRIVDVLSA